MQISKTLNLKLAGKRLHWFGHICTKNDERILKALLYSELSHESRPIIGQSYLRIRLDLGVYVRML